MRCKFIYEAAVRVGSHKKPNLAQVGKTPVDVIPLKQLRSYQKQKKISLKPGLHESQLQFEWNVTLLYSIVVERRC